MNIPRHLAGVLVTCLSLGGSVALATDAAAVREHAQRYHDNAKAIVEMAITKRMDASAIENHVAVLLTEGEWFAREYAKARPAGAKLINIVVANIGEMKKLSFTDLEHEWHDLHYFDTRQDEIALDLSDEDNEDFTDPIHVIVHPLLVLKAAQAYAAGGNDSDLAAVKEEMEEGIEQMEKQTYVLLNG